MLVMNILITGACGYIGTVATLKLSSFKQINKIVGVDVSNISEELKSVESYKHFKHDIRDPELSDLVKEENIDVIVHLASILNPPLGMSEEEVESIEIDGTENILKACVSGNVKKIIFMSSGAAYGYYSDNPELISEDHRIKGSPHFPYSKHKAQIEKNIQVFLAQHTHIKSLILRPGTVLGKNTLGPITDYFQKNLLVGVSGYESPFCFILDEDVCSAIVQGCLNLEIVGAYNLSGDGVMSLKKIAAELGSKYFSLPRGFMKFVIGSLKSVGLTQYSPYQVDFMCFRPVLDNKKIKRDFKNIPSKTTKEVFEVYKSSRNIS